MMRFFLPRIFFITFLLSAFSTPLFPAELEPEGTPARKLQRGFLNAAFAPLELFHHLGEAKDKENLPAAWFWGLLDGVMYTAGRAAAGAYEIVTFPYGVPPDYRPIFKPEYVWEYFD